MAEEPRITGQRGPVADGVSSMSVVSGNRLWLEADW